MRRKYPLTLSAALLVLLAFGLLQPGQAARAATIPNQATPIISEIMYNPASGEPDWEWVELYNPGSTTVDLSGYVLDDDDTPHLSAANIASGSISPGGTAILFNADKITAADFQAAWGTGINLVPVTNWPWLTNDDDQVGLWSSFTSYQGDHQNHANTVDNVNYDNASPWPKDNNKASIYLTDLAADNNVGSNWALSTVGGATPLGTGFQSTTAGGNSGQDIGSPVYSPPPAPPQPVGGAMFIAATPMSKLRLLAPWLVRLGALMMLAASAGWLWWRRNG